MANAGIANATGTRLDSADKHTMACKVDDKLLLTWFEEKQNSRVALHANKMKFAVQKDELVLNVTKKLNKHGTASRAYPSVVSSLVQVPAYVRAALKYLYEVESSWQFLYDSTPPPLARKI